MSYVFGAAAAFILIFIVLILQKKDKTRADYLLIGINVSLGLFLFSNELVNQRLSSGAIILQNLLPILLFGLFVFYVLQFIYAQQKIPSLWYLIFLPGLGFLLYSLYDHFVLNSYDAEGLVQHFNQPKLLYHFFFKGNQLLFIGLLVWILIQLNKFEKRLKAGYSFIETVSLTWLRNFTLIYLLSLVATFLLFGSQNLGIIPFEIEEVFAIVYGLLVLAIFYLNFEGIRHYTLAQEYQAAPPILANLPQKEDSVTSPKLQPSDRDVHQKLVRLFEEKKPYLTSKYGLRDLAEEMDESTHTISRVLNSIEQKSFYEFVNSYRVHHLQGLLKDPQNRAYTILALGLDSGFNSKASINRIFKKHTGMTPRQYLGQQSQPIG